MYNYNHVLLKIKPYTDLAALISATLDLELQETAIAKLNKSRLVAKYPIQIQITQQSIRILKKELAIDLRVQGTLSTKLEDYKLNGVIPPLPTKIQLKVNSLIEKIKQNSLLIAEQQQALASFNKDLAELLAEFEVAQIEQTEYSNKVIANSKALLDRISSLFKIELNSNLPKQQLILKVKNSFPMFTPYTRLQSLIKNYQKLDNLLTTTKETTTKKEHLSQLIDSTIVELELTHF